MFSAPACNSGRWSHRRKCCTSWTSENDANKGYMNRTKLRANTNRSDQFGAARCVTAVDLQIKLCGWSYCSWNFRSHSRSGQCWTVFQWIKAAFVNPRGLCDPPARRPRSNHNVDALKCGIAVSQVQQDQSILMLSLCMQLHHLDDLLKVQLFDLPTRVLHPTPQYRLAESKERQVASCQVTWEHRS